jgi:hypothetical protein
MIWLFVVLGIAACWFMQQGNRKTVRGRLLMFMSWPVAVIIPLAADIGMAQDGLSFQIQTGLLFLCVLSAAVLLPATFIYYFWKVRKV